MQSVHAGAGSMKVDRSGKKSSPESPELHKVRFGVTLATRRRPRAHFLPKPGYFFLSGIT